MHVCIYIFVSSSPSTPALHHPRQPISSSSPELLHPPPAPHFPCLLFKSLFIIRLLCRLHLSLSLFVFYVSSQSFLKFLLVLFLFFWLCPLPQFSFLASFIHQNRLFVAPTCPGPTRQHTHTDTRARTHSYPFAAFMNKYMLDLQKPPAQWSLLCCSFQ